jgi:hypothetical protein
MRSLTSGQRRNRSLLLIAEQLRGVLAMFEPPRLSVHETRLVAFRRARQGQKVLSMDWFCLEEARFLLAFLPISLIAFWHGLEEYPAG